MANKDSASGDHTASGDATDILAPFKSLPEKKRKRTLKEAVDDLPQRDQNILNEEIRRIAGNR
ncbi:conserved hypothetical protein [Roseibium sp. TrichSKD4]|uniref:hypothetical protein n=1 Tax=Roseibium sp. TrichSKD4 TaxID=744980 RepID=UPI0001E57533|nr:hypothetical protein [Roseibium sp. TrichSKD4]EFO30877.1 conserved hypothetical protein [Roseibium sp. TrichSKD4]